jgi:hypothetical protein
VGDRFRTFVFFKDQHTNPTFYGRKVPYRLITSRMEDLYYDCNFVRIQYKADRKQENVLFNFSTESSMPHFKSFMVRINRGPWLPVKGHTYEVKPVDGPIRLDVSAVNVFNRMGSINFVIVDF